MAVMNMHNTFIKRSLLAFFVIASSVICTQAQEITTSFITDTTCISNTDAFAIQVKIDTTDLNNGRVNIGSFDFTFEFDPDYLQFDTLAYINPRFLLDTTLEVIHNDGSVRMSWFDKGGNGATIGTANYFQVAFTGLQAGETALTFSSSSNFKDTLDNIIMSGWGFTDIKIHPNDITYYTQVNDSSCSDETNGTARIFVTEGESPFSYKWETSPPQYTAYAFGLMTGYNHYIVYDNNGCHNEDSVLIPVIPAPVISFEMDPNPGFIDKPIINFINTSEEGKDWIWNFGDESSGSTDRDPVHVFSETGIFNVQLTAFDEYGFGCDTTTTVVLEIKPPNLVVYDVITSTMNFIIEVGGTGDSGTTTKADKSTATLSQAFVSHKLIVTNRNGKHVYETTSFPEDGWDGENLSDGTYFYLLTCEGISETYEYRGAITIIGRH